MPGMPIIRAPYYVKSIDGAIYLFYPWISGDVTMHGMKPKVYVLQLTSCASASRGQRPYPSL